MIEEYIGGGLGIVALVLGVLAVITILWLLFKEDKQGVKGDDR